MTRRCAWCGGPIRAAARRDAKFCGQRCRQASHRFGAMCPPGRHDASHLEEVRRLAYADPPYPGLSARYYADHPDFAGEVDHLKLIRRLCSYDAWALSTSASSLPAVLELCPPRVRVAAWFRGERPTRSRLPLSSWEPVIYSTPARRDASPVDERRLDALVHIARPRTTDPARVVGAKPAAFAYWIFELLDATPRDEFHDLFPGSGGIARAWSVYASQAATSDASAS